MRNRRQYLCRWPLSVLDLLSCYSGDVMQDDNQKSKTGVVLVNLGSPSAPETGAVRRYLREFLSDPRVVEIPRLIWWCILNCVVLLVRPAKSAAAYRKIWLSEHGSPLVHYTRLQAEAVESLMDVHVEDSVPVATAMRYGEPSMASVLESLTRSGVEQILVLPMYPQYSATTTASVVDEVARVLSGMRNQPAVRFIKSYHDYEPYIAAMAKHIRQYWQEHGRGDKLILSFHGLPQRCIAKGDPYKEQCELTARLLADALLLSDEQWQLTFQSRFGAEEWLQPYTDQTLQGLGEQGLARVDVFCPGFAADCLETLEEIAMEARHAFTEAGGGEFHYIPALNAQPAHIDALMHLVEENLAGWVDFISEDSRNPIRRLITRVVGN